MEIVLQLMLFGVTEMLFLFRIILWYVELQGVKFEG